MVNLENMQLFLTREKFYVDHFKALLQILRFLSSKSSAGETKVFPKGPLGRREYRGVLRQPEEKQEKQTKGEQIQ